MSKLPKAFAAGTQQFLHKAGLDAIGEFLSTNPRNDVEGKVVRSVLIANDYFIQSSPVSHILTGGSSFFLPSR